MPSMTRHDAGPLVVIALAGVVASVVVYVLSTDVVWAIIPLLIAVAVARWLLRRRANR
jgi:hypothetical protein